MITVHHLEKSRSQRILWLLEELGLEYHVERYQRDPKTLLAPASLRRIHPLGKSPVITEDGRTVAESGAIVEYLIERHGGGRLKPATDSPDWLDYIYWLHYAEGSLMPLMVMELVFLRIPKSPMPFFVRPVAKAMSGKVRSSFLEPQIVNHLSVIERWLQGRDWFAGDHISGADIQMSFPLEAAAVRVDARQHYPNIAAYLDRVHAREAWLRALEKGGPHEVLSG